MHYLGVGIRNIGPKETGRAVRSRLAAGILRRSPQAAPASGGVTAGGWIGARRKSRYLAGSSGSSTRRKAAISAGCGARIGGTA